MPSLIAYFTVPFPFHNRQLYFTTIYALVKMYKAFGLLTRTFQQRLYIYFFFLLSAPSLSDFFIRVGSIFVSDTNFDPTTYIECWHKVDPLPSGNTVEFSCSETITGRFVLIHYSANKTGRLALCEVEVYLREGT